MSNVRIVFVGGYARTGSTLLDRLLGELDGSASFGEVRHIWQRSFVGDQLCGCGVPFRRCPFWTAVADRAFGGFDAVDARQVDRHKRAVDGFWNIPRMAGGRWPPGYRAHLEPYAASVRSLYAAMAEVSGARFLVDSTKDMQHAFLLRTVIGFDVRLVHLVRDSRAVAFSWTRVRRRPEVHWEDRDMPRFPFTRSAVAWDLANLAAEAARRSGFPSVRVRYEDLVADPRSELTRIVEGLDLGPASLGFLGSGTATLGRSHTVAGNPMRFREGTIEIRPDEEWRTTMPTIDRCVVAAATLPLLRRYGYRLGAASTARPPRAPRPPEGPEGPTPAEMWRTARLALASGADPLSFYRTVAGFVLRYLRARGLTIEGRRWLDVGAGSGTLAEALARAGGGVVALDVADRRVDGVARTPIVLGRGERLPFADGSFDGVLSSNVLEHVAHPWGMLDELLRVCSPGGVVYLSWTNWYSPFGGHDWSPFHYLGPRVGPRVYRAIRRRPPIQVPGERLFPVHVGEVLRALRDRSVRVIDVAPRYWPSLRFLAKVPVLREVALWNCVILFRTPNAPARPLPAMATGALTAPTRYAASRRRRRRRR